MVPKSGSWVTAEGLMAHRHTVLSRAKPVLLATSNMGSTGSVMVRTVSCHEVALTAVGPESQQLVLLLQRGL